jgi:hypothetical protein
MKTKTDLNIANTIYAQLGGSKFAAMTGAKKFIGRCDGLDFSIPSAKSINYVKITLQWDDLYTVEYASFRSYKNDLRYKIVAKSENIYYDDLQKDFTEKTGLYTSL